jgi:hypothetical protein
MRRIAQKGKKHILSLSQRRQRRDRRVREGRRVPKPSLSGRQSSKERK